MRCDKLFFEKPNEIEQKVFCIPVCFIHDYPIHMKRKINKQVTETCSSNQWQK